ncbi:MAG: cellulase family glycosylhydrolase [Clostridia bacterium]|nr:cellulase family glycosylhydrolase [Clostridia bacterium]
MRKTICFFLALFLAVSLMLCACESSKTAITSRDFLSVEDGELVNREGERVVLRGVNLGSWLLQECWMSPVVGVDGEWGNLDTIEAFEKNGLTQEQIQTLFETYQENWITEYDLDLIAESGANCVRVPFWYRNFMTDEEGTWIAEDPDQNPGFEKLDWVIREAGERGMYVILDLHGCPGGQSMNHCCGTVGRNDLYTSETCRATMKLLW